MSDGAYRIVVGVDGSEASTRALKWAVEAARRRGAAVRAVHGWQLIVTGDISGRGAWDRATLESAGQALLDDTVDRVEASGSTVPIERVLVYGAPASTLLDAANDADLVVVGTRGRGGFTGLLLGSVSHQVVQHAPCPAVVVPPAWTSDGGQRIVVGVDGSDNARAALLWAMHWADRVGGTVDAVMAFDAGLAWIDVGGPDEAQRVATATAAAEAQLRELVESVGHDAPQIPVRPVVVEGQPARVLIDQADDADLLVVGTRGRGGFTGLLLGSVSQRAVEHAPCPVAVIPHRPPADASATS